MEYCSHLWERRITLAIYQERVGSFAVTFIACPVSMGTSLTGKLQPTFYLFGAVIVAALLVSTALVYIPPSQWINLPLHAAVEVLGGLAAVTIALVLQQRPIEDSAAASLLVVAGFLAMGLLEVFHAITTP